MMIRPFLWFVPHRAMVNDLCLFQNNLIGMTEVKQERKEKIKMSERSKF